MPPSTWKSVEAKIAKYWPGAKRRGADYRNRDGPGGKNDLVGVTGWSVEIKHSKRPTYGLMVTAVKQAEDSRESPDDIPVAVIHALGEEYKDSLVIMRLETFSKFFINTD